MSECLTHCSTQLWSNLKLAYCAIFSTLKTYGASFLCLPTLAVISCVCPVSVHVRDSVHARGRRARDCGEAVAPPDRAHHRLLLPLCAHSDTGHTQTGETSRMCHGLYMCNGYVCNGYDVNRIRNLVIPEAVRVSNTGAVIAHALRNVGQIEKDVDNQSYMNYILKQPLICTVQRVSYCARSSYDIPYLRGKVCRIFCNILTCKYFIYLLTL